MVSDIAKETCKNWFYKIASIRELVPRLYVELAILKCYNFLAKDDYSNALQRLCTMIRGIGNPLVATYCRAYLCRKVRRPRSAAALAAPPSRNPDCHAGPRPRRAVAALQGMEVAPNTKNHLLSAFYDFTFAYAQLKPETVQVGPMPSPSGALSACLFAAGRSPRPRCGWPAPHPPWPHGVQDSLTEFNITFANYLDLFTPAVDWILQCVAHKAPKVGAVPGCPPACRP